VLFIAGSGVTPSATQRTAASLMKSSTKSILLLVIFYVAILSICLVYDEDVILNLHLACSFVISTTVFAPIDRAQVLLQVRALQRCADSKCLIIADFCIQEYLFEVTAAPCS
jgi:hypothetical protein